MWLAKLFKAGDIELMSISLCVTEHEDYDPEEAINKWLNSTVASYQDGWPSPMALDSVHYN